MNLRDHDSRCSEFEPRILDALVDGLDEETRRHLEACASCARLASEYVTAAEFGKRVLPTMPFAPAPRFHPSLKFAAVAAALALAVTFGWLHRARGEAPPEIALTVLPTGDAEVEKVGEFLARIRSGESTFVLTDPESAVETPFGSLRCPTHCEFTVRIEPDDCGWTLPATLDPAGQFTSMYRVAIAVASGEVLSHQNGRDDILAAAHRLNLPYDHHR